MTKENKLALVVGFGLVLLVGILISDHFSTARRQAAAELVQVNDPLVLRDRQSDPTLLDFQPPTPPEALQQANAPQVQQPATNQFDPNDVIGGDPADAYASHVYVDPRTVGQPTIDNSGNSNAAPLMASREQQVIKLPDMQREDVQWVDIGVDEHGNRVLRPVSAMQQQPVVNTPARQNTPTLAPGEKVHTIAGGESLSSICAKYYGDRSLVKQLASYNKLEDPNLVKVGQSLRIPAIGTLSPSSIAKPQGNKEAAPPPAPTASAKAYTIQPGDTLMTIASKEMGSAKLYLKLYDFNKDVLEDADTVVVGTVIKIPPANR